MIGTILEYVWHSVWAQLSLMMIIMIGLGAVAWFVPPLRRWAIGGILVIAGAAFEYAKGAKDAHDAAVKKQKRIEDESIKAGSNARRDAERDAIGGVRDGGDRDE